MVQSGPQELNLLQDCVRASARNACNVFVDVSANDLFDVLYDKSTLNATGGRIVSKPHEVSSADPTLTVLPE